MAEVKVNQVKLLEQLSEKLETVEKLEKELREKIEVYDKRSKELNTLANKVDVKPEDDPNWKPKVFVSRYRSLRLVNPGNFPRHTVTATGMVAVWAPVVVFSDGVYVPKNKGEETWILNHKAYKRDFWIKGDVKGQNMVMTDRVVDMISASSLTNNPNINPVDVKIPVGAKTTIPGLVQGEVILRGDQE